MKAKQSDFLTSRKVKVNVINPSYTYFGFIIGRDSEFIYLDTEEYEGVIFIPISNISKIAEKKEVSA